MYSNCVIFVCVIQLIYCREADDVVSVHVVYSSDNAEITDQLPRTVEPDQFNEILTTHILPWKVCLIYRVHNVADLSKYFVNNEINLDRVYNKESSAKQFQIKKFPAVRRPVDTLLSKSKSKIVFDGSATDPLNEDILSKIQTMRNSTSEDHVVYVLINVKLSAVPKTFEKTLTSHMDALKDKFEGIAIIWSGEVIAHSDETGPSIKFRSDRILFYAKKPPIIIDDLGSKVLTNLTFRTDAERNYLNLTGNSISGNFTMGFSKTLSSWVLDFVVVNFVKHRVPYVYAPLPFSYYFARLNLHVGNSTIQFRQTQVQPFFDDKEHRKIDRTKFGEALYDTGFITPTISAGLLISTMLLSVLIFGVNMLMSCKVMDRFDDKSQISLMTQHKDIKD